VTAPKVGDVVAWADVPDGAMVRWLWDGHGLEHFYRRHGHCVSRVGSYDGVWCRAGRDDGAFDPRERVTIVALSLTGQETANDLRRLAEVFEVREVIARMLDADNAEWYWSCTSDDPKWPDSPHGISIQLHEWEDSIEVADEATRTLALDVAAGCLHAAGWRPGMTAEDAARLLAEADRQ
jgi:hypothetical protein